MVDDLIRSTSERRKESLRREFADSRARTNIVGEVVAVFEDRELRQKERQPR
jgi:hypothetical protein